MKPSVPALSEDFAKGAREVLAAADFSEEGVAELLGVKDMTAVSSQGTPLLLYRTKGGSALEALVRLFVINTPVSVSSAKKALWPMALDAWTQAGLIRVEGDEATALVRLYPVRALLFMWDAPSYAEEDKVMGVAPSSLSLAGLTIRSQVATTLDLGTGCGIQGLLAAGHSGRVTALDRNPRATAFTEQNAILNGVTNVECLVGDRFEPARGRLFDRIVSNPPFVVSPGVHRIYRDSGESGDGFCRKLVREAPALLNEGGYCQMLCEWAHVRGEDTRSRLSRWFEGSACDVLILRATTRDVASYVAFWSGQDGKGGGGDHGFEAWSDAMDELGIEAVSFGFISMRRRSGAQTWLRMEDAPRFSGPCGEAVRGEFERRDFLDATRDDADLARRRLCASPDLQMSQDLSLSREGWGVTEARVRLLRGFAREGSVNAHLAALIERFYAPRRVSEVIHELAAGLGQSPASIWEGCLGVIRGLIEEGMLLPEPTL